MRQKGKTINDLKHENFGRENGQKIKEACLRLLSFFKRKETWNVAIEPKYDTCLIDEEFK